MNESKKEHLFFLFFFYKAYFCLIQGNENEDALRIEFTKRLKRSKTRNATYSGLQKLVYNIQ